MNWTETQNCWMLGQITKTNGNTSKISIDGVAVAAAIILQPGVAEQSWYLMFNCPIKKGQVVTTIDTGTYTDMKIYGLC